MERINLLPPEAQVKASRERGLIYAILILVGVVVVLGLVYVWQNSIVSSKQDELAQIQAQQTQVNEQLAALAPYAQIQAERVAMTATGKALYDARVPWSTILQEVSLVIPANVRLQSLTGTVPAPMLAGAAATPGATTTTTTTADVTFTGTTYTHEDVAAFMTSLGLIPQLTNIQLTSSTGTAPAPAASPSGSSTASTVTFTITAALRPYKTPPPASTMQQGAGQ